MAYKQSTRRCKEGGLKTKFGKLLLKLLWTISDRTNLYASVFGGGLDQFCYEWNDAHYAFLDPLIHALCSEFSKSNFPLSPC